MGTYNKVAFVFRESFWSSTSSPSLPFLGLIGEDYNETICAYLDYNAIKGVPVLVGSVANQLAERWDSESESSIVENCLDALERSFPEYDVKTCFVSSFITRWGQDPFTIGSYSCMGLGSTVEDIERLQQRIIVREKGRDGSRSDPAVILFAGEACSVAYQGTMHGAYISGQEQAHRLVADYRVRCGESKRPRSSKL